MATKVNVPEDRKPAGKKEPMRYCTECGTELLKDDRFCADCGTLVVRLAEHVDTETSDNSTAATVGDVEARTAAPLPSDDISRNDATALESRLSDAIHQFVEGNISAESLGRVEAELAPKIAHARSNADDEEEASNESDPSAGADLTSLRASTAENHNFAGVPDSDSASRNAESPETIASGTSPHDGDDPNLSEFHVDRESAESDEVRSQRRHRADQQLQPPDGWEWPLPPQLEAAPSSQADDQLPRQAVVPVSHRLLLAAAAGQVVGGVVPVGTIDAVSNAAGNPSIHVDALSTSILLISALGVVYWVFADLRRVRARRPHPLLLGLWTTSMSIGAFVAANRSILAAYDDDLAIGKNGIAYGPGAFVLGVALLAAPLVAAVVIRQRRTAAATDGLAPWPTRSELTRLVSNRGVQVVAVIAAIALVAGVLTLSLDAGDRSTDRYIPDFGRPDEGFGYQWPEATRVVLYSSCVRLTDSMGASQFAETSCDCLLSWSERDYPASFGDDVAELIQRDGWFPRDERVVAVVNHCFGDGTM